MEEEKLKFLQQKAQLFFDKRIETFVMTVNSEVPCYTNGYITEITPLFFILKDSKTSKSVPIFFAELEHPRAIFEASRR